MKCPFCNSRSLSVVNTRSTRSNSQVWRRRLCLKCKEIFTTHEIIDLSHLTVAKKTGKIERYSRIKLFSGILFASQFVHMSKRELYIDAIVANVEERILSKGEKQVTSLEITDIVLSVLAKKHIQTFIQFLVFSKSLTNKTDIQKELEKYSSQS